MVTITATPADAKPGDTVTLAYDHDLTIDVRDLTPAPTAPALDDLMAVMEDDAAQRADRVAKGEGILSHVQITAGFWTEDNGHALDDCYSEALQRVQAMLRGTVTFRYVIQPDGTVGEAAVKSSEIADTTMQACMLTVVRGMHFDRPQDNGSVTVTQPIIFDRWARR